MDDKTKKYLKWIAVGALVVISGVTVVPYIIAAAANIAIAAAYGLGLFAFWAFLPAIVSWIGLGAWKLKELVWKSDPIAKLWMDLNEFGEEIEALDKNIQEVATEEFEFEGQIKRNRDILGPERVLEWNERVSEIKDSKQFLIEQREELRIMYKEMERDVRINEVEWKLGNAYNKAANAVNKANNIAGGTQGGRVAMDTIQHRLSEGRARLQTLRTRKSASEIREIMKQRANGNTIDVKANVVNPAPALVNNPSPVLQGLLKDGKMPTTARPTPVSKAESLIDRI